MDGQNAHLEYHIRLYTECRRFSKGSQQIGGEYAHILNVISDYIQGVAVLVKNHNR
jgi:hypothetical protein